MHIFDDQNPGVVGFVGNERRAQRGKERQTPSRWVGRQRLRPRWWTEPQDERERRRMLGTSAAGTELCQPLELGIVSLSRPEADDRFEQFGEWKESVSLVMGGAPALDAP